MVDPSSVMTSIHEPDAAIQIPGSFLVSLVHALSIGFTEFPYDVAAAFRDIGANRGRLHLIARVLIENAA